MRFTSKGLGVLALTAVCSSMANAYAFGGAWSSSGTYLVSGTGADVTLSFDYSVLWPDADTYSYGSSSDESVAWTDNYMSNGTYGISFANPVPGGSFDTNSEYSWNFYVLTNNSQSTYEFALLDLYTSNTAVAYSDGNGYGEAVASAMLFDETNGDQYSSMDIAFSGLNRQGWNEDYFSMSVGGSQWSQTLVTYFGADTWVGGGAGWSGAMELYLAPGETDIIGTSAATFHVAVNNTPGPAAMVPFAIGLAGVLRRRRGA
jgi:hypothetical protein